jgi:protein SCO1
MTNFVVKSLCSMLLMAVGVYGTYSAFHIYNAVSERAASAKDRANDHSPGSAASVGDLSKFNFTERSGKAANLKDLEGKVWVASFFFASCPGFCTQMNQQIAKLQSDFKNNDVTFVSITVDPRNDTPEKLATYAEHFRADPKRWLFLTGPFDDAHELGEKIFRVTVVPKDHTDRLILVDRDGKVRGTYRSLEPTQLAQFKKDLKKALAETPAKAAF